MAATTTAAANGRRAVTRRCNGLFLMRDLQLCKGEPVWSPDDQCTAGAVIVVSSKQQGIGVAFSNER